MNERAGGSTSGREVSRHQYRSKEVSGVSNMFGETSRARHFIPGSLEEPFMVIGSIIGGVYIAYSGFVVFRDALRYQRLMEQKKKETLGVSKTESPDSFNF